MEKAIQYKADIDKNEEIVAKATQAATTNALMMLGVC